MLTFLLLFIIVITIYSIKQTKKPPQFPPGPAWIPFAGSLPEVRRISKLSGGQHLGLWELAKQYKTNVLGLKLGDEYVVVVFSYPIVREVLLSDVYNSRPDNFFLRLRCMGTRLGITCAEGELHSIQRGYLIRHLRQLGFGKKTMELMIKDEIVELLNFLEINNSEIEIGKILAPSILNILWNLTTGSRFSRDDEGLQKLLDLLEKRSKAFDMSGGTLSRYPWLRFIAPEATGYTLIRTINRELKRIILTTINEHRDKWNEGIEDDLIYFYLNQIKSNNKTFTDDQLIMVCLDIFIAGSQTTSNTLNFAFLMMILHPDVQEKVYKEIHDNLPKKDALEYFDKTKVPFVEAVLLEVERYCNVVPISGPRRALEDTVLDSYLIPKNTTVLISQYSVHNEKEYWKDPEVFRPERFLDENGKLLSQDRILTFGLGKRRCIGEILAKSCLFLFFVEILRKFEIQGVASEKKPSDKPLPGITLSPQPYRVKLVQR